MSRTDSIEGSSSNHETISLCTVQSIECFMFREPVRGDEEAETQDTDENPLQGLALIHRMKVTISRDIRESASSGTSHAGTPMRVSCRLELPS